MDDICSDKIFGFVKCNIRVPDHLIEEFSEYTPIFKNTEIDIKDIDETDRVHVYRI